MMHHGFSQSLDELVKRANIERILTFYNRAMQKILHEASNRTCLYSIDRSKALTWSHPTLVNFLLHQFREATVFNSHNGSYTYEPSALIRETTEKAKQNLNRFFGVHSLHTPYYLSDGDPVKERKTLEIARVLVWSEDMLLSALGQQVVDLHRIMNIPCFFIKQEDFPITEESGHEFFIATPPDKENCKGDAAIHIFLDNHGIRQRKEKEKDPLTTFRNLLLSDKIYIASDYRDSNANRKNNENSPPS